MTAAARSPELTNEADQNFHEPLAFRLMSVGNILQEGMFLRNDVLSKSTQGPGLVERYDSHAEELVEILKRTPGLARRVVNLAVKVAPFVHAVNSIHEGNATKKQREHIKVPSAFVDEALSLIDAFAENSENGTLRQDAQYVKNVVRGFAGLRAPEILRRLDAKS